MIGIPCFGKAHFDAVTGVMNRITPEAYDLLMQFRGWLSQSIGGKPIGETQSERHLIAKIDGFLCTFKGRIGTPEDREPHIVYLDYQYHDES